MKAGQLLRLDVGGAGRGSGTGGTNGRGDGDGLTGFAQTGGGGGGASDIAAPGSTTKGIPAALVVAGGGGGGRHFTSSGGHGCFPEGQVPGGAGGNGDQDGAAGTSLVDEADHYALQGGGGGKAGGDDAGGAGGTDGLAEIAGRFHSWETKASNPFPGPEGGPECAFDAVAAQYGIPPWWLVWPGVFGRSGGLWGPDGAGEGGSGPVPLDPMGGGGGGYIGGGQGAEPAQDVFGTAAWGGGGGGSSFVHPEVSASRETAASPGNGSVTISCTLPALAVSWKSDLSSATAGTAYDETPFGSPTGGAPPHPYTAVGLPPGLHLTSSGQITGTPTMAGTGSVTFTVTDSSIPAQTLTSKQFSLTVDQVSPTLSITADPSPAVAGLPTTLTATLAGAYQPTGTVTFREAGAVLTGPGNPSQLTTDPNGAPNARFTTGIFTVGIRPITAS